LKVGIIFFYDAADNTNRCSHRAVKVMSTNAYKDLVRERKWSGSGSMGDKGIAKLFEKASYIR